MDLQFQCRHFLSAVHLLRADEDVSPVQVDILKELALTFDEKLYKCEDLTSIKMRLEEVTREHFDTLFQHLPIETCHSIATTNAAAFSRHTPTDTRQLVYGEIDFVSFKEVLRVAMRRLQNRKKFVDLGHGIGKAILAAVFLTDFSEFHGVEILQDLHDTSQNVLTQFKQSILPVLTKSKPLIDMKCGSFLSAEISASWPLGGGDSTHVEYICDWTDADVVFANSTCFPSPLMRQIETMCREMKEGSRVITFTTGLNSEYFKIIFKKQLYMSWGPATVFVHERLANSDVVAGEKDRLELLSPRYNKWANPSPFADKSSPLRGDDNSPLKGSPEEHSRVESKRFSMTTATANVPSQPALLGKNHSSERPMPLIHSPLQSSERKESASQSGSNSSNWDPDTPTLKNWAREQLAASQTHLKQLRNLDNNGISSDSEDSDAFEGSPGSKSTDPITTSFQRGSTSISTSTSSEDDIDNTDLDFKEMNIARMSYYIDKDGLYGSDSDSDNQEESCSSSDSDIDNDDISEKLATYYHVKDDSEDAEDEDDVDELYDDSS